MTNPKTATPAAPITTSKSKSTNSARRSAKREVTAASTVHNDKTVGSDDNSTVDDKAR
ncbi:hypothetical protein PINS_up004286 [Pythium insidiosum]|nr:hypothetical protein PINS_up004286 [Pythium insidiosum]